MRFCTFIFKNVPRSAHGGNHVSRPMRKYVLEVCSGFFSGQGSLGEGELPEEAARTPRLTQRWEEYCPKTPVCNSVVGIYTHGGRSEWERDISPHTSSQCSPPPGGDKIRSLKGKTILSPVHPTWGHFSFSFWNISFVPFAFVFIFTFKWRKINNIFSMVIFLVIVDFKLLKKRTSIFIFCCETMRFTIYVI